jgi:hypothetical protein
MVAFGVNILTRSMDKVQDGLQGVNAAIMKLDMDRCAASALRCPKQEIFPILRMLSPHRLRNQL